MSVRRIAALSAAVLLAGSGTAALTVNSAEAAKQAARTYGVVAGTRGDCMQRFENLSRNLAGKHMISMLPCGRWNAGSSLWSGSITVAG